MTDLPPDLVARGFVLIARAPGRVFAVSERWGCSLICPTVSEAVASARTMVRFCEYVNRKKAEECQSSTE